MEVGYDGWPGAAPTKFQRGMDSCNDLHAPCGHAYGHLNASDITINKEVPGTEYSVPGTEYSGMILIPRKQSSPAEIDGRGSERLEV
eukprot:SAG11_NODE_769_length_7262_cov_20.934385_8_plen_87_part_00